MTPNVPTDKPISLSAAVLLHSYKETDIKRMTPAAEEHLHTFLDSLLLRCF